MNQSGFRDTVLRQSYVFNTGKVSTMQGPTAMSTAPSFPQPSLMTRSLMEMISASITSPIQVTHTEFAQLQED